MTVRSPSSDPHRITAVISGSRGHWTTRPLGGGGSATLQTSPTRSSGRPDDGLSNPQAFSLPLIQTYPRRTAICRQCPELEFHSCARGCCNKLSRGHSFILNAIADGVCPLGKFQPQEL